MHPLVEPLSPDSLRLFCPAKLNLSLSVGSARPDGLHPVASWMVPIDFGDTLAIHRCGSPVDPRIAYAGDAPRPCAVDWPTERDLAVRAWRTVETLVGRPLPIEIVLTKRVPTGAGLGGGSANAAAMLDGLNRLFGLALPEADLLAVAKALGADVAFQFAARLQPAGAVVGGSGDQIQALPARPACPVLLILPAFGCPTAEVYRAFDRSGSNRQNTADLQGVRALAAQPLSSASPLWNDLAGPAATVRPELKRIRDMAAVAGFNAHVTGSGAALFVVPADTAPAALERARQQLASATRCPVLITSTAG